MIYLTWQEAGTVIRGWTKDTCKPQTSKQIDFVDNELDHGNIRPGQSSPIRQIGISTCKFDPSMSPTMPITNCKLFMAQYYPTNSIQSMSIPTEPIDYASSWSFCGQYSGETTKNFTNPGGYWADNTPAGDISEIQNTWPSQENPGGVWVSVNKGQDFVLFNNSNGVETKEDTYIDLLSESGGSTNNGQIDPGNEAEIQLYVSVPPSITRAGVRLFLIGMMYDYSE